MLRRSLVVAGLIVAGTSAAEEPESFEQQVNGAIDRGVRWLLHQQELDGSFPSRAHQGEGGLAAFVAYTLLKSGVPAHHHAIERALARVEGVPPHLTYEISALLMALDAHPEDHSDWMREHVEALIAWRHEGGLGYPVGADLSNTQFGTLGLWIASRAGLDVPASTWVGLAESVLEYQQRKGGFAYKPGRHQRTGSMTIAGITVLAICRERLRALERLDEDLEVLIDESMEAGLEWLIDEFTIAENPRAGRAWHLYYLYGLERLGALLSTTHFGEHDWYREGALEILELQEPAGHWLGKSEYAPVASTCFALLFLRRATQPVTGGGRLPGRPTYGHDDPDEPVSLLAAGDAELDLWIGSVGWKELRELCPAGEELPRIESVEYSIDGEAVATITGDLDAPADLGVFRAHHEFQAPGIHHVVARMRVLRPDAVDREREDAFAVLVSDPLEIDVIGVTPEWMLQLSREAQHNLLRPGKNVEITVSSMYSGDVPGIAGRRQPNEEVFLVDNAPNTAWIARERERKPKLRLDFDEPIQADSVVWLPVQGLDPHDFAPALEVQLVVNRRHDFDVTPSADPRAYTRVDLGEVFEIERLELKVLEKGEGRKVQAVGFAEVQCQLRSRPRRRAPAAGRGR